MGNQPEKVVEVTVGELRCAIPLERVIEVLPRVVITRLPGVPPPIAGYLRHRGRIVPALDLRRRLAQQPGVSAFDEHVLLVRVRGPDGEQGPLALLVDRVNGILELRTDGAAPPGPVMPPVEGMVSMGDGLLLVVDPDRALTLDESRALSDALHDVGA